MPTLKQHQVLNFIEHYLTTHGYAPNYQEIAQGIGTRSRGSVSKHIHALAEQGLIECNKQTARGIKLVKSEQDEESGIPLVGKIAAGKPLMAFENIEKVDLHQHLQTSANCYLLEVYGESMKDCGILPGDWVLVQTTPQARNGQIVVALIDNYEATLKRFRKNADATITLIPENRTLEPMTYPASSVAIQGIVIAQVRRYN